MLNDYLLHYIHPSTLRQFQSRWKSFQAFLRDTEESVVIESVGLDFSLAFFIRIKAVTR